MNTRGNATPIRIDPTKGFVKGNVELVHETVAKMMGDLSQTEFVDWVFLIATNMRKKAKEGTLTPELLEVVKKYQSA